MSENELSLPDKLIKNTVKEDLISNYNNNTTLRSLAQIVPFGSMVDTMLTTSYNNILVERAKVFYNELESGQIELTQDIIQSEDFLHSYFATLKAALYTKQRIKIRFFARMLKNGLSSSLLSKADEYDDYLKILDDLTLREIVILHILNKYECNAVDDPNENELGKANSFWNDFVSESTKTISIDANELSSTLTRIQRTGCYKLIIGTFVGYLGDRGYTTETYRKLMNLIEVKGEEFVYYYKSLK